MTKKEFKEQASFHQYGRSRDRTIAIYFDWKSGKGFVGFKFKVVAYSGCPKALLIDYAYRWMIKGENLPCFISVPHDDDFFYPIESRRANTDEGRFKVPLSA